MNNKKAYLYYPSYVTGGAEYLLKTTADILKDFMQVVVVDVKDGWLSNNISDIEVIYVSDQPIYLDEDAVLITTANLVRNIDNLFCGDFKLLSWVVQIFNVVPVLPKFGGLQHKSILKHILKKTVLKGEYNYFFRHVSYLKSKDSIFVMDDGCSEIINSRLGVKLDSYLPVVIPDNKILRSKKIFHEFQNKIRILWLGRLDGEFKNPILKRVVEDVSRFAKKQEFEVTVDIIGDGPGFSDIVSFCKKYSYLHFIFHKEKRGTELQRIIQVADIGFAMGTSALEIGACYTPIVLLDASYNKVGKNYRYKWLYEEKGYSVGRSIDSSRDESMGNKHKIEDIFFDFIDDPAYQAERCYLHVLEHHSVASLRDKLLNALSKTEFSFDEAKEQGLFKKPFWYPLKKILHK